MNITFNIIERADPSLKYSVGIAGSSSLHWIVDSSRISIKKLSTNLEAEVRGIFLWKPFSMVKLFVRTLRRPFIGPHFVISCMMSRRGKRTLENAELWYDDGINFVLMLSRMPRDAHACSMI